MRFIALIFALLLSCSAQAQIPMTGAGLGAPSGGGGGYTGPLDINGTAYAFWSTRCGSTSYTGNVVDIWDSATGSTTETLVTCSAGGVLNTSTPSPLATTCASGCKVKTIYDQSGSNNCSGACNVTQATNSARPTVTLSCSNGKICLAFVDTNLNCFASPATSAAQAQPYTVSDVHNTSSGITNRYIFASSDNTGSDVNYGNGSANQVQMYAGLSVTATATDNATHAVQTLFNSTTSAFYVDGTLTSGLNAFTLPIRSAISLQVGASYNGGVCGQSWWAGNWFEVGVWGGNKTANNATMNSNQHAYWGF